MAPSPVPPKNLFKTFLPPVDDAILITAFLPASFKPIFSKPPTNNPTPAGVQKSNSSCSSSVIALPFSFANFSFIVIKESAKASVNKAAPQVI